MALLRMPRGVLRSMALSMASTSGMVKDGR